MKRLISRWNAIVWGAMHDPLFKFWQLIEWYPVLEPEEDPSLTIAIGSIRFGLQVWPELIVSYPWMVQKTYQTFYPDNQLPWMF